MPTLFITILLMAFGVATVHAEGETRIFHPAFHSLQIHPETDDMAPAIIRLGSDDRLTVSFDELAEERRQMRYELLHCTSTWQPDRLVASEYLRSGFNEGIVDDYAYSRATTVHYVNYRITVPNAEMEPTLSGNYLLRVYDESDPDETLLTARFCVVEPLARIKADVTSRTDIDRDRNHQQLSVAVDVRNAAVNSPATDLRVVVTQNSRTDNTVTLTAPTSLAGSTAVYDHQPQLIFPAGNEYRRFETVSTRFPGMGVDSYMFASPLYHAALFTDTPRSGEQYTYDSTQHGRYRVRTVDSADPATEADYVMTHFTLDMPEIPGADIYIDGDLTLHRRDAENRMMFNRATGLYECALLLKQGSYNYIYLTVPRDSIAGLTAPVEGDNYATDNEYLILVYHTPPGQRHERLIGATIITAGE